MLTTSPDDFNVSQSYIVRRCGDYMATLIITCVGGETLDSILAQFG